VTGSAASERLRDVVRKSLIVVGVVAAAVAILLGSLQIDVISPDGRFFFCGAVFRPTPVLPEAAAACRDALATNSYWATVAGASGISALVAGIVLRATVPKRLQHRR
jgi:hypothetical protein